MDGDGEKRPDPGNLVAPIGPAQSGLLELQRQIRDAGGDPQPLLEEAANALALALDQTRITEESLRSEVRAAHEEMERRVLQRTAQLEAANVWKEELLRRERVALADADSARRDLVFLAEASRVLAGSLDLGETMDTVARIAVPRLADWCLVDMIEDERTIRMVAVAHADPSKEPLATELRRRHPPDPDEPHVIWKVIRTGLPDISARIEDSDLRARAHSPEHLELLRALGIRSHIVVPLQARGQALGAMSFVLGTSGRYFRPADLGMAEELARRCAMALDNALLYEAEQLARHEAEAAQRRLSFLLEASTVVLSSLDLPKTLAALGRVAVTGLADLCLIDLLEDDGSFRRVVALHADPAKEKLAGEELIRYPPDPTGQHPAARVVRTGRSEFSPEMPDQFIRETTRDEEHYRIGKELGFQSWMCVPLSARGRVMGTFTLVSTDPNHRFSHQDLALAEDLAGRAALAVDNARLYRERDYVARTLQDSLLPPDLPEIPGLSVTARYRPAGEGNEVGGDFYDVFQVPGGAWALVIGDVGGKGADAAAVMGLVRHTIRAAAVQERAPSQVLRIANEALRHQAKDERFATVAYARLAFASDVARLTVCSAGHPLPLVARRAGEVERIGRPGTLLGPFDRPELFDAPVALAPGDTMVLYTDGVTEERRASAMFGEDRLLGLLRTCAGVPAPILADRIEQAVIRFSASPPRDDMALLILQVPGPV